MLNDPGDTASPVDLAWPRDRPETLPFLPLVYVAWADGVLEPGELERICERIEAQDWLDAEAREAVQAWLRPEAPPSPSSLERLRERVRSLGPGIDGRTRRSLVELGIDLARAAGRGDGPWASDEARRALDAIEGALGVVGEEVARRLVVEDGAVLPPPRELGPTFDVDAMAAFLSRPHGELRERVLDLLAEPDFAFPIDIDRETYRERVLAACRRLADEGLGGLAFAPEHGGEDAPDRAVAVFETLAFGDLSVLVKFGVHFGLFGGSVHQLGNEQQRARWLPDVATLELPGCFAMTEVGHGSNVRDIETTATWDPGTDELVIHTPHDRAEKHWIGNAALHGRVATVFAQLQVDGEEHGVHAVVVPLRDSGGSPLPGVSLSDCGAKVGLEGVDNGRIGFDRVRVPRTNLLDRFGRIDEEGRYHSPIPSPGRRFFTMLGTLVAGRISIAAAAVSVAKTGLTVAVRYSAGRRQFGPSGAPEVPILDYLTHQRLLLPKLGATYGLHFAVRDLVARYDRLLRDEVEDDAGTEQQRIEVEAAGLKAYASRHCLETLQAGRESLGGEGYRAANRFGRLRADTDVFTTFEGANVVLLQLVARGLLSDFREEMGDLRLWDMVKYIADRAETRIREMNPVQTRRTDPEHLGDPDVHLSAFRYREDRLLESVARRLKTLLDDDVDSFDAMNRVQDHLVTLARAHMERRVLECFQNGVKRASSPGLSEILRSLATLWALERIESDRGWFLENGYLEGPKTKAVRDRVNALCRELTPHAVSLVNAFGIPDAVLAAPAGVERPR